MFAYGFIQGVLPIAVLVALVVDIVTHNGLLVKLSAVAVVVGGGLLVRHWYKKAS